MSKEKKINYKSIVIHEPVHDIYKEALDRLQKEKGNLKIRENDFMFQLLKRSGLVNDLIDEHENK